MLSSSECILPPRSQVFLHLFRMLSLALFAGLKLLQSLRKDKVRTDSGYLSSAASSSIASSTTAIVPRWFLAPKTGPDGLGGNGAVSGTGRGYACILMPIVALFFESRMGFTSMPPVCHGHWARYGVRRKRARRGAAAASQHTGERGSTSGSVPCRRISVSNRK